MLDTAVPGDSETYRVCLARIGGPVSWRKPELPVSGGRRLEPQLYGIPGRDAHEILYIAVASAWSQQDFECLVKSEFDKSTESSATLVFLDDQSALTDLPAQISMLCSNVDILGRPGERILHHGAAKEAMDDDWDPVLADRIDYAVRSKQADTLKSAVLDLAKGWRLRRVSYAALMGLFRAYLLNLGKSAGFHLSPAELERRLDGMLAGTTSYDDAGDTFQRFVLEVAGMSDADGRESDVPEFFSEIRQWVRDHYADPLTLESVGERFRISGSYLSKLYRKFEDMSFGEVLTRRRIEAASRLIHETPGMPLKDVAERADFCDPYYFSRVFKSVTGLPPSEYARKNQGD